PAHLAQVPRNPAPRLVLSDARVTDDFQLSHFGEVGQHLILDAIGEKCIGTFRALILERENGDALPRDVVSRDFSLRGGDVPPGMPEITSQRASGNESASQSHASQVT